MPDSEPYNRSPLLQYREKVAVILLVCLTLAAYGRITGHEFIGFDDNVYVYENRQVESGIQAQSLAWAFSIEGKENTYWHPLTWVAHMLDVSLFGLQPAGHHFISLLLHLANSLLLYLLLRLMTGAKGRSWLVAGLFALHPLNVESVAWIAERKNVLSTFFWMLTLLTYVRYCRKPALLSYLTVLLAFGLGLLAKPMLVTLPCVLLLMDFWPLGRVKGTGRGLQADRPRRAFSGCVPLQPQPLTRLLLEKIPLLILSGLSVIVSAISLQHLGTTVSLSIVPLDLRIANALVSYTAYIRNMVWPVNLAVIYPYPAAMLPYWQVSGAVLFLVGVTLFSFLQCRRRPYMIVGWLWFLGTLTPVLGIVQSGLWPALADRWAYVPLIGLFIMVAWGGHELFSKQQVTRRWSIVACTGLLVLLAVTTWKQTGYWADSITLFERTLAVTGPNCAAHDILGVALAEQGRIEDAIAHYRKALQIQPDFEDALRNLGGALFLQGNTAEAIDAYTQVLEINPYSSKIYFNLGVAFEKQGAIGKALASYGTALKLKPGFAQAHYNLGVILAARGQLEEAIEHYADAVQTNPEFEKAYNNLGKAFGRLGQTDKGIAHFKQALRLNPENAYTHFNLGVAFTAQGNLTAAREHYLKALSIAPDFEAVHNNIAVLYRRMGNLDAAHRHLQAALEINPANATTRANLARIQMLLDQ